MKRFFSRTVSKTINPIVLVTAFFLAALQPAHAQQKIELVFGLYTTDKPSEMVKTFRPILSALEKDLSSKLDQPVDIRLQISRSYESGVAAIVNGEVDFSRFGPASYVAAVTQNPGIKILALGSKNNQQTTKGVICVAESSSYTKVSDLKGARFAFGNKASTIGRYLSQSYLFSHGVSSQDLASFDYLDRHDRVGYAVAQNSFDAGALKQSTFNKLIKKGLPLRALATFDNVNKPWIARAGMQDELFNALRDVMFEMDDPDAFKLLGQKMFVPGSDTDFEDIRNAINNNAEFFKARDSLNTAASEGN